MYLAEAREHGLDSAILNAKKIIPTHKLGEDDLKITRDLIYDRRADGYDPLFAFIERFAGATKVEMGGAEEAALPLEERLKKRIVDGNKIGFDVLLDEALKIHPAARHHQPDPARRHEASSASCSAPARCSCRSCCSRPRR